MLRPMKGFGRLGVDTMAMPDGGGSDSGGTAAGIWPLLSTPAQPWAFGPSSAAEIITPPSDYGPPAYGQQGPPAPSSSSQSSISDALKNMFAPSKVAVSLKPTPRIDATYQVTSGGVANRAPARASTNTTPAKGGGILDILASIPAGILGATPALINAYTAVKYPGSPQAQAAQMTNSGPPIPVSKTPWGTYMLIGAGVVVVGIAAVALTSSRKRGRR